MAEVDLAGGELGLAEIDLADGEICVVEANVAAELGVGEFHVASGETGVGEGAAVEDNPVEVEVLPLPGHRRYVFCHACNLGVRAALWVS